MNKETIKDVDWQDQQALVRVDFNVPLSDDGRITDDARIRAALPTIEYLLDHDASVVLMSHLGRPKDEPDPKFSLEVVADHLATLVEAQVEFCPETVGPEAEDMAENLQVGDILVLENTRFDPRKEEQS